MCITSAYNSLSSFDSSPPLNGVNRTAACWIGFLVLILHHVDRIIIERLSFSANDKEVLLFQDFILNSTTVCLWEFL